MDGYGDFRMEEALHAKCPGEQGGLGKVFVLRKREEWAMEVPVWNKDDDVSAWMRAEGEDACDGRLSSGKYAIVAGAETALDARAVGEGEGLTCVVPGVTQSGENQWVNMKHLHRRVPNKKLTDFQALRTTRILEAYMEDGDLALQVGR